MQGRILFFALAGSFLAFANTGCESRVGGTIVKSTTSASSNETVVLTSTEIIEQNVVLSDNVKVAGVKAAHTESDHLQVQVALENLSEFGLLLEYRFEWQDDNGMKLPSTLSSWNTMPVGVRDTVYAQAVAPDSRAVDFVFYLRFRYD